MHRTDQLTLLSALWKVVKHTVPLISSAKENHGVKFVGISNCRFVSNYGAIGTESYYRSIEIVLLITDTLFEGNWRSDGALHIAYIAIKMKNCQFINNSAGGAITGGGAITARSSSLEFDNTVFCNTSGPSIIDLSSSNITINKCHFVNN